MPSPFCLDASLFYDRWSLPRLFRDRVDADPDRPFLGRLSEEPSTLSQFDILCRRRAGRLREGLVEEGQRVVVFTRDSFDTVVSWFALSMLGAVEVPINHGLRGQPLASVLNAARTALLITDRDLLPAVSEIAARLDGTWHVFVLGQTGDLASGKLVVSALDHADARPLEPSDLPDVSPVDLSSILFSSGTSGPPKGILVPHGQAVLTAGVTAEQLAVGPSDVFYCAHPMFHMAGKHCAVLAGLAAGAVVHLDDRFRAEIWLDNIRACGATVTLSHGPMLEMVFRQPLRDDDRDNPLRRLITSPFPRSIAAAFERRFAVRGLEAWGMTEVGIPCWSRLTENLEPGACGRPVSEWYEMRVGHPETDAEMPPGAIGEFMVRPRLPGTIMQGYFADEAATVKAWRNLWFHSGDLGYRDGRGVFHFVDRGSDRIRRRAENIASFDIESAANQHAAVLESAAVGVPSGFDQDDDIKLFVIARQGARIDPAELIAELAHALPHYMVPRYIAVIDAMPRTPTNKVRKSALKAADGPCWDRHAAGLRLKDLTANAQRPAAAPSPLDRSGS